MNSTTYLTKGEKLYCEEHNMTEEEYISKNTPVQRKEIKQQMKKRLKEEKQREIQLNKETKQREKEEKQKEKEAKIQSKIDGYEDWFKDNIRMNDKGIPLSTFDNIVSFIDNYPGFRNEDGTPRFSRNAFTGENLFDDKMYDDDLINNVREICNNQLNHGSKNDVADAMNSVCVKHSFNPVRDAIENNVLWDMTPRIETFFIDYIGVADTPLNRALAEKFFYALMARLYNPGCVFDCMLTVQDELQGTGKTRILERLLQSVGLDDYFCLIQDEDLNDKDTKLRMSTAWIVVLDELSNILKKDAASVKTVISQRKLEFRRPYARTAVRLDCPYVLYGNTNKEFFLQDYESEGLERRFWVTEAHGVKRDKNQWDDILPYEVCRQVLAEAKTFYDNNPKFAFNTLSIDEERELQITQDKHKSSKQNIPVQYAVARVLEATYSKKEFGSYEEFRREAYPKYTYSDMYEYGGVYKIDKIPTDWIKCLVNEVSGKYNNGYSVNYITPLIKKEWERSNARYNKKRDVSCYVRRGSASSSVGLEGF